MATSLLPSTPGLLPKWQLFVAATALFNSIQNLFGTTLTKQVYANKPEEVYELAMWTYVSALLHFGSEWLIYRSAKIGRGLIGPLLVARKPTL
ncbi:hypothetical protein Clacol_002524 [Clathrus columnatus]|uniref:Erg28-like protein n=1 Tax=Clathrus columnatus TaxID=1419009 RepID=A0AAV5A4C8_9AGAM|nr:hypothetical protein Clacol_002524 [Clathrus columnatus]